MEQRMTSNAKKGPNPLWFSVVLAVILRAIYIYVYQVEPLPSPWNEVFWNFICHAYLATVRPNRPSPRHLA